MASIEGIEVGHDHVISRDEGSSLNWHRDNKTILEHVPVLGKTSFARGALQKAVSTREGFGDALNDLTATNSPATLMKRVMAQVDVDESLLRGVPVTKVTTHGKYKRRIVTLAEDRLALFCTHSKIKGSDSGVLSTVARTLPLPLISRKGIRGFSNQDPRELYVRYIDIADIDFVSKGFVCTRKIESARHKNRLKGIDDRVDIYSDQIVSIGHHGSETLDIFIADVAQRTALVKTLLTLRQKYDELKLFVMNEARLLRYIWYDIDDSRDGYISQHEFAGILHRINLHIPHPKQTYKAFQEEKEIEGPLSYHQCMTLLDRIKEGKYTNKEAHQIYALKIWDDMFGADQDYASAQDFLTKFLVPHQKENDATVQDANYLISTINKMETARDDGELPVKEGFIGRHRFQSYLNHTLNDAFDPDQKELKLKLMNQPLTEYWINTSHNTYLAGDQLQSASTVEMYMTSLLRGCKCLELDCWDGERKAKTGQPLPVIFHGGTLTSKILFEDVVECVRVYVDENPDTYPIILSLENHCSAPFQEEMASILKDTLEEKLYAPFASEIPNEVVNDPRKKIVLGEDDDLPSPEQLRGLVVIKGKRPPDIEHDTVTTAPTEDDEDDEDKDPYESAFALGGITIDKKLLKIADNVKSKKKKAKTVTHKGHSKIVPELMELTLFHGCKYKNWEQSLAMKKSHMHSIGENKISKLTSKGMESTNKWRQYNQRHMTRTYPAGTRVDSSNYNPVLAWSVGSQLVALNFQTADAALVLNDGRFRQNGQSGYVLKPPSVMGQQKVGSENEPTVVKIRILSGSCLPKPYGEKTGETIDPYVQVTVHDVAKKGDKEQYKSETHVSKTINDNGFNPVWDESEFKTYTVHSPDVAMIQFSLMEADVGLDDKVSDSTIPMNCLRPGYRSILLYDKNGRRSGCFNMATLLVEIQY